MTCWLRRSPYSPVVFSLTVIGKPSDHSVVRQDSQTIRTIAGGYTGDGTATGLRSDDAGVLTGLAIAPQNDPLHSNLT